MVRLSVVGCRLSPVGASRCTNMMMSELTYLDSPCQMWRCQIINDRRFRMTPIQLIGWFWAIVHADFYLNWRYLIQGDPIILIGWFCYFLQRVAPTCQMWWCQIIHDRRFRMTPIQLIGWFWAMVHADFYLNWRYLIQGDPIILIGWFC